MTRRAPRAGPRRTQAHTASPARALAAVYAVLFAGCQCEQRPRAAPPGARATAAQMVLVPGGSFMMGAVAGDPMARPCESPRHRVTLSSFYLDRHEVTVAQYAEAVSAGVVPVPGCKAKARGEKDLCTWGRAGMERHPINGISWFDADNYCRWRGKRLPTEAEHEYVMRDRKEGQINPWGNDPNPPQGIANIDGEETAERFPDWPRIEGYRDPYVGTSPVGSFPANSFGVLDILGNQWEWCSDWFGESSFSAGPKTDPKGPASGTERVMRGGGFHCEIEELRNSERHHKVPADNSVYVGVRCAKDAP